MANDKDENKKINKKTIQMPKETNTQEHFRGYLNLLRRLKDKYGHIDTSEDGTKAVFQRTNREQFQDEDIAKLNREYYKSKTPKKT